MTTTLRLNRPQTRARRSLKPYTTLCLAWGRGVGKSWFLRLACYLLVEEWESRTRYNELGKPIKGVRIVLVGPTIEQLKKVHGKDFDDELGPGGPWEHLGAKISHDSGGWRITFPGGSWLQWVTAERARGARGIRCDVAVFDEADDIHMDVYDAVTVPWFSGPESLALKIVAGTPTKGRHGLLYRTYSRGLEKAPGHISIHATYRDAPDTVSPAQVEEARLNMPPEFFAREWECNFDSGEGLVYPAFKLDVHVREPHHSAVPTEYIVGLDWGFVDPTAILLIAIYGKGNDAVAWVLRESYISGWTIDEIADLATRWQREFSHARWFADCSQPAQIEVLRRRARINISAASNQTKDRDDGLYTVASWLMLRDGINGKAPKLYVHPDCKNTIKEFGLYRRKRNKSDGNRVMEQPEDKNDHAMDALRYALFSRFGLPPAVRHESGQGK